MCTAMMGASAGLSLMSGAISAYGQNQQANAQAASANFNAKQDVQSAQSATDAMRINAQNTYRQGDILDGQARAAMGANGINPGSGTALQTQVDIGKRTGQDVANEEYNARLGQTAGLNQSNLQIAQAASDHEAGNLAVAGTLLSTASQVSGKWASWQQLQPSQAQQGAF